MAEIILCWVFVGVLWILARCIGYKEGFKDGYKQGEKDFKPRKGASDGYCFSVDRDGSAEEKNG